MVCWPPVHLEGHLIIRGHDDGAFEVRFVPANLASPAETPPVRLPDPPTLERALADLGLDRDRVVEVASSPYALHSLRVRIDRGAARRLGLVTTPLSRVVGLLAGLLRGRPHSP
jgi:hypothetical protein